MTHICQQNDCAYIQIVLLQKLYIHITAHNKLLKKKNKKRTCVVQPLACQMDYTEFDYCCIVTYKRVQCLYSGFLLFSFLCCDSEKKRTFGNNLVILILQGVSYPKNHLPNYVFVKSLNHFLGIFVKNKFIQLLFKY